ncbi:hypothetical protein OG230_35000 [Streptomyces sp. NBC_00234]|uniref:hypothetical protein n=1 Tax=Streptomyces sp. NBC_00234 TaxID=2903638 RepID=UPI002E2AA949|nr:hypothetical protein [Streptomyces sp. NBC_00234]
MASPILRAIEADETVWDDPSDDRLHDLLADMSLSWRFVVVLRLDLEPADQHYMQVYLNDDLSYQLEYREGGPEKHFQAEAERGHEILGLEPVAKILQDWARGRPGWRDALPWRPWPSPAPTT